MRDNKSDIDIPVVDLFAGPGGLGEGFSSFTYRKNQVFHTCLSIEKEPSAHRTLRLRSLFRKIPFKEFRDTYIEFAKSDRTESDENQLFECYKNESEEVEQEVLCKELGGEKFPQFEVDKIIRQRINKSKIWVLIGGPPCQAYSLAGRSRMSQVRKNNIEEFENDERHYLYQHYLRIIQAHRPPVFVMENVKGLLSSTIGGALIIDQILRDLKNPSGKGDLNYNLYSFVKMQKQRNLFGEVDCNASDFIIKSEHFGIPQTRHRLIIFGVRSDINITPTTLKEAEALVPLKDILSDLPKIRSEVSLRFKDNRPWGDHIKDIKRLIASGSLDRGLGRMMSETLPSLGEELPSGGKWLKYAVGRPNRIVNRWYRRFDIGIVCNHEARSHMPTDLLRYYFASCFAEFSANSGLARSPRLTDFPIDLLPNHKNINLNMIKKTAFDDRFRVQLLDQPGTTVTSHISKDGHYFIHPDPRQCRSLTVREAARIQTFPDNYIFLGSRTQQYGQVGNAVPPLLARQLANVVFDLLKKWSKA